MTNRFARGWNPDVEGNGVGCNTTQIRFIDTDDRIVCLMYGFLTLEGVPGIPSIPSIPASIVSLYIMPTQELDLLNHGSTSTAIPPNTSIC